MRSSRQLIGVSVGVLIAVGQAAPGTAQFVQERAVPSKASSEVESLSAIPSGSTQAAIANLTTNSTIIKSVGKRLAKTRLIAKKPNLAILAKSNVSMSSAIAGNTGKPSSGQSQVAGSTPASQPAVSESVKTAQQELPTSSPSSSPSPTPAPSPNSIPAFDTIQQAQPIGPAKPGAAPEYLNPDPNPLSFPTKPEEVTLRGVQPITLKQAIELAKRNSRRATNLDSFQTSNIQTAYLQLEQARAALRQAQAALYPTIGVTSQLTQSQGASGQLQEEAARQQRAQQAAQLNQPNQPGSRPQIASSDRSSLALNGTVQVSYDIYTGGRRPAQIRAAERQVRIAELQYQRRWIVLQEDVKTTYYQLQQADETVRIQRSAVRNAEASLRDTQALERAGLGTRFDVLRAQVQLANAQQQLTRAIADQNTARQQLAQLLAVPPTIDLAAADPVDVRGAWNITLEGTILLALKYSTQLEQLLVQRELSDQQRIIALSALRPRVNLSVQYNVLNNLRDTLGFGDGYSVAAGFQWDFFDGGAARASARQQELDKRIAESNFASIRELIIQETRSTYETLLASRTNITTARLAREQAREALRLARLRFQAGVGTQTEVINAENDLTNSEGNVVTAILDYNRAIATLERIVGDLPIPTGEAIPIVPAPISPTVSPIPSTPAPVVPSITP